MGGPMIFVIVLWRIKKDRRDDFIKRWKEEFVVNDRSNLIGEFLSEPIHTEDEQLRTLKLAEIGEVSHDKVILVNVGVWASEHDFHKQVGKFIKVNDHEKRDFEYEVRLRVLLNPIAWRRGDQSLPKRDTGKTF